jgi:hypothetical protein
MNTYKIEETQGINNTRAPRVISVKTLAHAKTNASRGQSFYGTWLHIYDEQGNHIARKNPQTKKWENTPA